MIENATCQSSFKIINYRTFFFNKTNTMKKLCLSLFYSSLFPTYLSILVDDFYPFGNENGDSMLPKDDEIFSESIEFPTSLHSSMLIDTWFC